MSVYFFLGIILIGGWDNTEVGFQHPERKCHLPFYQYDYWDEDHDFDVLDYDIDMTIDIPNDSVWAEVTLTLEALSVDLDTLGLHFDWSFTIESIVEDGRVLDWERTPDKSLKIVLGRDVDEAESLAIKISYHGIPHYDGEGGLFIDSRDSANSVTATNCEPVGSRKWIPCYDLPSDKATFTLRITVPEGNQVVGNGTLESELTTGDWWSYVWREHYPQPTYDIALGISKHYVTRTSYASIEGTQVPMTLWLLAENADSVEGFYSRAPEMLEFLSDIFPAYAYKDEKYDHVHTPLYGMEHTTCTALDTYVNWGAYYAWDDSWDWVVVHEMAHHWWGNWVTCATWPDIWLNEGFATYCEALWFEHDYGEEAYDTHMKEIMSFYLDYVHMEHPLYDTVYGGRFDAIAYDKGGSVLHMLRQLLGRQSFLDALSAYGLTYAHSAATTQEFQEAFEVSVGSDLDWFFDQWIFAQGYPQYNTGWKVSPPTYHSPAWQIEFAVSQMQDQSQHFFPFRMPAEIGIYHDGVEEIHTFTDSLGYQRLTLEVDYEPDSFLLDPANKILCKTIYHDDIDDVPNPGVSEFPGSISDNLELSSDPMFSNLLRVSFSNPGGHQVSLNLYDASGRQITNFYQGRSRDFYRIYPLTEIPDGIYFLRLEESSKSQTVKVIKFH